MGNKKRRGKPATRPAKIRSGDYLLEGKSHISNRRLTIRPGFLSKGISSETARKSKNTTSEAEKKRENILREDLHSFFDRRSLRRSDRVSLKSDDDNSAASKPKSNTSKSRSSGSLKLKPKVLAVVKNPKAKPIVRNNSKSIFKDINEKYIKVELHKRNQEVSQKIVDNNQDLNQVNNNEESNRSRNKKLVDRLTSIEVESDIDINLPISENFYSKNNVQNIQVFNFPEKQYTQNNQIIETSNRAGCNPKIQIHQILEIPPSIHRFRGFANQTPFFKNNLVNHNNIKLEPEVFKRPLQVDNFKPPTNQNFCDRLEKQVTVKLKKNDRVEVFERINEEINKTNLILQGKINYFDNYASERYQPEKDVEGNETTQRLTPIPPQKWVFKTPPRQRLGAPQIEGCHMQTGVICSNSKKNHQYDLYEFKPECNPKANQFQQIENIPIDNRFLKCVAQINRTPFGTFGLNRDMQAQGLTNYRMHEEQHQQLMPNLHPNYQKSVNGFVAFRGFDPNFPERRINEEIVRLQDPHNLGFYPIISRPCKTVRRPNVDPDNFRCEPRPPMVNPQCTEDFEKDFTFIGQDDGGFKLQESQKDSKKCKTDDEFLVRRTNSFQSGSANHNLFNFNQVQNKNNSLFQFGQLKI